MRRLEMIVDHRERLPVEIADQVFLRDEVAYSLSLLTDRERHVLKLRYGLDPFPHGVTYTLEEMGRILKCIRERVRAIECMALAKLRRRSRCGNLICFLEHEISADQFFADEECVW